MDETSMDSAIVRFHTMAVPRSKPWVKVTEDDLESVLDVDLNRRYIRHRAATFLFPANEEVLNEIRLGDLLIVDRAVKPQPGRVIIAEIEGKLTLRRIRLMHDKIVLVTDLPSDAPYITDPDHDYCWGVVTQVIHDL